MVVITVKTRNRIRRSISLLWGFLLAINVGNLYAFSSYSKDLADMLGVPNADFIGSVGDLGVLFGFTGGFLSDRFGRVPTAIVGTVVGFCGFFFCWLVSQDIIPRLQWAVCIFFFMFGQGNYCGYINGLTVNVKNFGPLYRGRVTSLAVAGFALSPVLFSTVYTEFLQDVGSYFLFCSIVGGSLNFLSIFLLAELPPSMDEEEEEHSLLPKDAKIEDYEKVIELKKPVIEDITIPRLFLVPKFWMLLSGFCTVIGVCFLWKNIRGSVNLSHNYSDQTYMMILVSSILDGSFRVFFGFIQDVLADRVPRPFWTLIPTLLSVISIVLYLFIHTTENVVYVLWFINIATGFGTAATFTTTATLTFNYFGTKYMGFNYGILCLSVGLVTLGLTTMATEFSILEKGNSHYCMGYICWNDVFVIASVIMTIGLVMYTLLTYKHVKEGRK
eukprot:TRINITY_DN5018_c0_g1_i1.p1 TRINITY_DN5018_c0_g1~~TRINITY_DN5018_c0_g1_i1.p1  ORF type:complete len:443 (-),score=10.97 TRINITY_DN5018_c0_g1_i1:18-1346(-)